MLFFLFFSSLVIYFIFLSFIISLYKILLDHLRRVVRFSRVCSRRVSGRADSAAYAGSLCFFCRGLFGAQYLCCSLLGRTDLELARPGNGRLLYAEWALVGETRGTGSGGGFARLWSLWERTCAEFDARC